VGAGGEFRDSEEAEVLEPGAAMGAAAPELDEMEAARCLLNKECPAGLASRTAPAAGDRGVGLLLAGAHSNFGSSSLTWDIDSVANYVSVTR
jgi:hypothetical protein